VPTPPLPYQLQLELDNIAWVVKNKPLEWDGFSKKADQELDYWLANVSYWRTYPTAPKQLSKDPADKQWVETWLRMHALVQQQLAAEVPAPTWDASKPRWPLTTPPVKWKPGSRFGVQRPWDDPTPDRNHCGIDLRATLGSPVVATEAGVIVGVDQGWELPTKSIVLHLDSGYTLLIGGLKKGSMPPVGTRVTAGQQLAVIEAYPRGGTMAHVQLYKRLLTIAEVNKQKSWYMGQNKPPDLIDPADYLETARLNTELTPQNAGMAFYGFQPDDPGADVENVEQSEGTDPPGNGGGTNTNTGTSGGTNTGTSGKVSGPPATTTPELPWAAIAVGGVVVLGGLAYVITRR